MVTKMGNFVFNEMIFDSLHAALLRERDMNDILSLPLVEKLHLVTQYLRSTHYYCIYCCSKFDSVEDLEGYCPGLTEDDHD